jgi:hypothetical protein
MIQSSRLSRFEIGLDLCLTIVVNYVSQAVFLKAFTTTRALTFTGVTLTLAMARRYLVRRSFNRFAHPEQGQSQGMSLLETTTDTVLAIAMALILLQLWYRDEPLPRLSVLVVAIYLLALVRRYGVRRFFEWIQRRSLGHPRKAGQVVTQGFPSSQAATACLKK